MAQDSASASKLADSSTQGAAPPGVQLWPRWQRSSPRGNEPPATAPSRSPRLDRSSARDHFGHVRTVSVSELKAHLSRYLREVHRGTEVQILDRGVPVARLTAVPGASRNDEARRQRLIRAGAIRPGSGDVSWVLSEAPLKLPARLGEALAEQRADRL